MLSFIFLIMGKQCLIIIGALIGLFETETSCIDYKNVIPDSVTFHIKSIELIDSLGKEIDYKYNTRLEIEELQISDSKIERIISGGIARKEVVGGAVLYSGIIKRGEVTSVKMRLPRKGKGKEIRYKFIMTKGCYHYRKEFTLTPPLYQDTLNIRLLKSVENEMLHVDQEYIKRYKSEK